MGNYLFGTEHDILDENSSTERSPFANILIDPKREGHDLVQRMAHHDLSVLNLDEKVAVSAIRRTTLVYTTATAMSLSSLYYLRPS